MTWTLAVCGAVMLYVGSWPPIEICRSRGMGDPFFAMVGFNSAAYKPLGWLYARFEPVQKPMNAYWSLWVGILAN